MPQSDEADTTTKGDDYMMATIGFGLGFVAAEIIGILAAAVLIISNDRYKDVTHSLEE